MILGVFSGEVKSGPDMIHIQIGVIILADYFLNGDTALKKLKYHVNGYSSPSKARFPMLDLRTHSYMFLNQVIHRIILPKQSIPPFVIGIKSLTFLLPAPGWRKAASSTPRRMVNGEW